MLIYEALISDHKKLKALLRHLVDLDPSDDTTRHELLQAIRDELIPHSRAEEAVFYNPLKTIDGMSGLVNHGYAEHMEAETLLRLLQTLDAADIEWKKAARKLKEGVEHHIEEEETKIIPAARQVLVDEEARLMCDAFEEMKPVIRKGSFVENTLDLVANIMPARFAEAIRSFAHRP